MKFASLSFLLCLASASAFAPSPGLLQPTKTAVGGLSSLFPSSSFRTSVILSEGTSSSSSSDDAEEPSDALKTLLETPEIMELLKSEKMQEAMSLVMAGKQEELQKRVQEDAEFQVIVRKLEDIMSGAPPDE